MENNFTVAQAASILADVQLGRQLSVPGAQAESFAETLRRELMNYQGFEIEIPTDWDDDWFEEDDEMFQAAFEQSSIQESFMPGGGAHWELQPRGKDGKWIYSGVDTSKWSQTNSAAASAKKKIKLYEKLVALGQYDELFANPPSIKSKVPNQFQKGVIKAHANLVELAKKLQAEQPKNAVPVPGTPMLAGWTKVGESLGTEKGGTYIGPDGAKYYVKIPDNPARAHNEVLAFKLYELAGANVVKAELVQVDGKVGVATKWEDSAQHSSWGDEDKKLAAKDFAAHAWLANWDAVGAGSENPMDNIKKINGKMTLVDAGGSLEFKGMGGSGKKPFGGDANEWDTLRDPSINKSMATVFGGMTSMQLAESSVKVASLTPGEIKKTVEKYHPGTPEEKEEIASKLISRAFNITAKGKDELKKVVGETILPAIQPAKAEPIATPKTVVTEQPSVPVAPALSPPPNVNTPKNPSAQTKLNEIYEAANKGGLAALMNVKTNATSQNTYAKKAHAYKLKLMEELKGGAVGNVGHNTPMPSSDGEAIQKAVVTGKAAIDAEKKAREKKEAYEDLSSQPFPKSMFPTVPSFMTSNAAFKKANEDQAAMMINLARTGKVSELEKIEVPSASAKMVDFKNKLLNVAKNAPAMVAEHKKKIKAAKQAAEKAAEEAKKKQQEALQASAAFQSKWGSVEKFAESVPSLAPNSAKKVGWWSVIQENTGFPKIDGEWLLPKTKKITGVDHPFWDEGHKQFMKLPSSTQQAILDYTTSGYHAQNESSAKGVPSAKAKLTQDGVRAVSVPLPMGSKLSRKYSPGGNHNLESIVGAVFQQSTVLSTSTDINAWHGSVKAHITIGPGVKGLPIDKDSENKGESEVILHANQRFVNMGQDPSGIWQFYALPTTD